MTESIVFSPRRRAFVNKPGQVFRAEEYTDVNGKWIVLIRVFLKTSFLRNLKGMVF